VSRPRLRIRVSARFGIAWVVSQLEREHQLNELGSFLKQNFSTHGNERVKMFWEYDFHPYVAWYLNVAQEVSASPADLGRSLQSGRWNPDDLVVVENAFAAKQHCNGFFVRKLSANFLWSITSAGELEKSCGYP
jgi:hypothetical protein